MKTFAHSAFDHLKQGFINNKKTIAVTAGTVVVVIGMCAGAWYAYATVYDGRIYPHVRVNGVDVSGLTQTEAKDVLEERFQSMLNQGLTVQLDDHTEVIDLHNSGATDPDLVYDLMSFDSDAAATAAVGVARTDRLALDQLYSLLLLLLPHDVDHEVTVFDSQIVDAIEYAFKDAETPGSPADFDITESPDGYEIEFVPAELGILLAIEPRTIVNDAQDLDLQTLTIALNVEDDMITEADTLPLMEQISGVLNAAPYTLRHTTEGQRTYDWKIEKNDLVDWLAPMRNEENEVFLGLDQDAIETFFKTIHETIDVKPTNARFVIEDGKVVEFAGSLDGVSLNEEATLVSLLEALGNENVEIEVAVVTVEPDITTGSVNNLGIEEIVGVGISNFSGSPYNRIQNIKHGAAKLNGLLIAPGDTFSLLEALKPFTISDGWLPELVIKGDEIKPEVGGGACQFGTTLFRATMNAGLEVVQRRNHSLVVSYYNDPQNGNPGTDATIYDPAPDYQFKNDTENYLLLTTEIDLSTRDMIFTFWGTSDGREGSYTPPQIVAWTGYGETIYKETPDLPPGVEKCQAPHPGAQTSFDYNVTYADGTEFSKTFTSTYRSLPWICLVGIGESGSGSGGGGEETPTTPPTEETTEELDVEDVDTTEAE